MGAGGVGRPRTADRETRDVMIAALYRGGWSTYAIADNFKLTRPRISQILHEQAVVTRGWRMKRPRRPSVWTTDRRRHPVQQRTHQVTERDCLTHGSGQ